MSPRFVSLTQEKFIFTQHHLFYYYDLHVIFFLISVVNYQPIFTEIETFLTYLTTQKEGIAVDDTL